MRCERAFGLERRGINTWVPFFIHAGVQRLAAAGVRAVDKHLQHAGPEHGGASAVESGCDALNGREVDLVLVQERVEELIKDRGGGKGEQTKLQL